MKRIRVLAVLITACGVGSGVWAQADFDLGFEGPGAQSGNPGALVSFTAFGTLETVGLGEDDAGAQGWSLSIVSENCTLTDIGTDGTAGAEVADGGLRNTGFEKSEIVDQADNGGLEGGVSAVVLSFTMPITLAPTGSVRVVQVSAEAQIPDEGTSSCALVYQNGLRGSGQPVDNKITLNGETVLPALGRVDVPLLVEIDCSASPLAVAFQEAALGQLSDPLDESRVQQITLAASVGEVATGDAYVAIASQLSSGGVQGWSLSVGVDGLDLLGASTDGTVGADATQGGLRNTGFEKTEVVDPLVSGQGQGAVSAVVLSFTMPITLEPTGLATVLGLEIASSEPVSEDGATGHISMRDGLVGAGQPVSNVATVGGATAQFCALEQQVLTVHVAAVSVAAAVNGDANGDARLDIADPIYNVNALFRGGPSSACAPAADANDDGLIDLSDVAFMVEYLFNGGQAPSSAGCVVLQDATPDNCPAESTACP